MKRVLAAAMGLTLVMGTSTPTPTKADSDDLAKALAGIAAVAIIARAIDDRNDRKSKKTVGAGRLGPIERGYSYDTRRVIDGTIRPYHRQGPKPRRGFKRRPLPQNCLRVVETDRGDRLAYGSRCLNRNFGFASRLPQSCETVVRTPRGFRAVYGARCLRRDGWNVARR